MCSWVKPLALALILLSQPASAKDSYDLVVVISIDQLPYEYLVRFAPYFGPGGFRLLLEEGASFTNARFEHAFNLTGPAHAVISTGSYGHRHGIVGNNWYDIRKRENVYSVGDPSVKILGVDRGGVSPTLLRVRAMADELRNSTAMRSRVISISQKNRSAILMGGRLANAAYWLADSSFVTSTYYMSSLPSWVAAFNSSGLATSYLGRTWRRSLPEEAFKGLDIDDAPYEGDLASGTAFPHHITGEDPSQITRSYYSALWNSPFLNELMMEFTKEAVIKDSLGIRGETDALFLGLSANDAVGHTFGPQSHEVLEITVHTDSLLQDFFHFLDQRVGLSNCLIALTSDHGIAPIPEYLLKQRPGIKAGRAGRDTIKAMCDRMLVAEYGSPGSSWIERIVDGSIYLNRDAVAGMNLSLGDVVRSLAASLRDNEIIGGLLTSEEISSGIGRTEVEEKLRKGYFPGRSGDIVYALIPYFIDYSAPTGTDHGQPYAYDDHVPVIFYGKGILPGRYHSQVSPADIVPTLSALIGIPLSREVEGRLLKEALRTY